MGCFESIEQEAIEVMVVARSAFNALISDVQKPFHDECDAQ